METARILGAVRSMSPVVGPAFPGPRADAISRLQFSFATTGDAEALLWALQETTPPDLFVKELPADNDAKYMCGNV